PPPARAPPSPACILPPRIRPGRARSHRLPTGTPGQPAPPWTSARPATTVVSARSYPLPSVRSGAGDSTSPTRARAEALGLRADTSSKPCRSTHVPSGGERRDSAKPLSRAKDHLGFTPLVGL